MKDDGPTVDDDKPASSTFFYRYVQIDAPVHGRTSGLDRSVPDRH
jgi:hypothetical protein